MNKFDYELWLDTMIYARETMNRLSEFHEVTTCEYLDRILIYKGIEIVADALHKVPKIEDYNENYVKKSFRHHGIEVMQLIERVE